MWRTASWYERLRGRFELRFEAPGIYSFMIDARRAHDEKVSFPPRPGDPYNETHWGIGDEPRFLKDTDGWFHGHTRRLAIVEQLEIIRGDGYEQAIRAAVEWEAERAALKEDEGAIAAAQQGVLDDLAGGKKFYTADHEGVTEIFMKGGELLSQRTGDDPSISRYASREAMLEYLRNYFNFRARLGKGPHKPPELEIWKFIRGEFR